MPLNSANAPFIFCDGVAAFGINQGGIVRLELGAHTTVPEGSGTRNEIVIVAHLRFSRETAEFIRDAIDKALKMPEREPAIEPVLPGKPN